MRWGPQREFFGLVQVRHEERGAALKRCDMLTYMPVATSFTGVNQLLDGLQDWLQQNQNHEVTERQSSERSGLELTLTAQGLRAKPRPSGAGQSDPRAERPAPC